MKVDHQFDGGLPQFFPGCERYIGQKPSRTERGGWGFCDGCCDWHPTSGGRLDDHDPSPPQIPCCPYCGRAYYYKGQPTMSYTDPPCDNCARAMDAEDLRRQGYSEAEIAALFGEPYSEDDYDADYL